MGEAANEERFAWLLCYGMSLNGWSVPNFKIIGNAWGNFLQVDEPTLKEVSYEKGRLLIATEQSQKISGFIELDILGKVYMVRVEEESSFRIIKDNMFSTGSPKSRAKDLEKDEERDDEEEHKYDDNTKEREQNAVLENNTAFINAGDGKIMNAESNTQVEKNLHTCNPINNSLLDNMAEVEEVDESPGFGAIVEVVDKNHNEGNMQLVTYKHALEISKNIQQPQLSTGSAKVASIYIEKAMRDTVFKSQNSHIDTSLIPKITTHVEVNEKDHNSSWSVVPFNWKKDGASKKILSEKFKRKKELC